MVSVRVINLQGKELLNAVEQTAPLEDVSVIIKSYTTRFSKRKLLKDRNFFEVLLDPNDRNRVTLIWVQSLI